MRDDPDGIIPHTSCALVAVAATHSRRRIKGLNCQVDPRIMLPRPPRRDVLPPTLSGQLVGVSPSQPGPHVPSPPRGAFTATRSGKRMLPSRRQRRLILLCAASLVALALP